MARIEKFEDLVSWQKARVLAGSIYSATKSGEFARDFVLRDQIRRATVSIISNIAEGFERGGDKEFAQFLSHAKGSSAELRSQLYVALDQNYITKNQFEEMMALSREVSRLLSGLMTYLAHSTINGRKFKAQPHPFLTQDTRLKT